MPGTVLGIEDAEMSKTVAALKDILGRARFSQHTNHAIPPWREWFLIPWTK